MLATETALQQTLRWTRRTLVVVLIVTNFMAVILADAGRVIQSLP